MKELRNNSRLAKTIVIAGIVLCLAAAIFYMYKAIKLL